MNLVAWMGSLSGLVQSLEILVSFLASALCCLAMRVLASQALAWIVDFALAIVVSLMLLVAYQMGL